MAAKAPVRRIPVSCAPKKAPCPECGRLGRRQCTLEREVRSIAYKQIVVLDITYGEYATVCDCSKSFRNRKLRYWEKVRYKWRRRRTLVKYIVLTLDRWWSRTFGPTDPPFPATTEGSTPRGKTKS